jgi:hypothetical protein
MLDLPNLALLLGGALSAAAGIAHLACIFIGAPAYRFMGAGEQMARAAQAGKLHASFITLFISAVLFAWAAYAFSGAGVIGRLPLAKWVLCAICAVYLGRALVFPWLKPFFPENSQIFWWVSSSICLALGAVHSYGLVALWHSL